ncbi:MAG: hypothetical protein WCG02_03400 [Candidatus Taylorbacteria bacterium]
MKISLLIISIALFLYSGFLTLLALGTLGLGGGLRADPVLIGTLVMTTSGLIGIIGMASTYKKTTRTVYYVFAIVAIAVPALLFQLLSSHFGN